jgi:hypothetical protein
MRRGITVSAQNFDSVWKIIHNWLGAAVFVATVGWLWLYFIAFSFPEAASDLAGKPVDEKPGRPRTIPSARATGRQALMAPVA